MVLPPTGALPRPGHTALRMRGTRRAGRAGPRAARTPPPPQALLQGAGRSLVLVPTALRAQVLFPLPSLSPGLTLEPVGGLGKGTALPVAPRHPQHPSSRDTQAPGGLVGQEGAVKTDHEGQRRGPWVPTAWLALASGLSPRWSPSVHPGESLPAGRELHPTPTPQPRAGPGPGIRSLRWGRLSELGVKTKARKSALWDGPSAAEGAGAGRCFPPWEGRCTRRFLPPTRVCPEPRQLCQLGILACAAHSPPPALSASHAEDGPQAPLCNCTPFSWTAQAPLPRTGLFPGSPGASHSGGLQVPVISSGVAPRGRAARSQHEHSVPLTARGRWSPSGIRGTGRNAASWGWDFPRSQARLLAARSLALPRGRTGALGLASPGSSRWIARGRSTVQDGFRKPPGSSGNFLGCFTHEGLLSETGDLSVRGLWGTPATNPRVTRTAPSPAGLSFPCTAPVGQPVPRVTAQAPGAMWGEAPAEGRPQSRGWACLGGCMGSREVPTWLVAEPSASSWLSELGGQTGREVAASCRLQALCGAFDPALSFFARASSPPWTFLFTAPSQGQAWTWTAGAGCLILLLASAPGPRAAGQLGWPGPGSSSRS